MDSWQQVQLADMDISCFPAGDVQDFQSHRDHVIWGIGKTHVYLWIARFGAQEGAAINGGVLARVCVESGIQGDVDQPEICRQTAYMAWFGEGELQDEWIGLQAAHQGEGV